MNIVLRELRAHTKSIFIWSVCIIAIMFMGMSEFSAYYNNPEMAAILDQMPEGLMKAFGMDSTSLTTVHGFYGVLSTYNFIIIGIHAVLLGSGIIAKEERDKTAEFLMTMPVSRTKVVLMKLTSALIICVIMICVVDVTALLITAQYNPGDKFYTFLGLSTLGLFLIQMIFMSFGMMVSSIMKRYKKSGTASLTVLLVTYVFSIAAAMNEQLDFLKYLTPFKYFEATTLLVKESVEGIYVLISVILTLVFLGVSFVVYPRRDLHI